MRRWGRDRSSNFTLAVVCAVLFLTFLDTTIVSVALSDIQARLHAGVSALQWVVNGYALTFASLMLTAGSLSDRFGRRKVMLVGLAIFGAGSAVAMTAPCSGRWHPTARCSSAPGSSWVSAPPHRSRARSR